MELLEKSENLNPLSKNTFTIYKSSFKDKLEFEAHKGLIETRSDTTIPYVKEKEKFSEWDKKAVDLSWKLYQPKPPKRNTREAIRPWIYDKYLRSDEENAMIEKYFDKNEFKGKTIQELVLDEVGSIGAKVNIPETKDEFQAAFRLPTPQGARIEASKTMGFRIGLDQFKNPKPHDFRGLKPIYGAPEFQTLFEADPNNVKFLSKNLSKIHGLGHGNIKLRDVKPGLQMGDIIKVDSRDLRYDPLLILPRLSYPNKFYGTTRYRPINRSVESAYWDRVLPKLNEKWKEEKEALNKSATSSSHGSRTKIFVSQLIS